jgi:hypothetical protein
MGPEVGSSGMDIFLNLRSYSSSSLMRSSYSSLSLRWAYSCLLRLVASSIY